MVNGCWCRPNRFCLKKIGPGELSFTPTATTRSSGDVTSKTIELTPMSNALFMDRSHALIWGRASSRKGVPDRSLMRDRQLTNSK